MDSPDQPPPPMEDTDQQPVTTLPDSSPIQPLSLQAAFLSTLIPGLGQIYKGQVIAGCGILAVISCLIVIGWALGKFQDRAAEIFFFIMTIFPFWILQSYDALLTHHRPTSHLLQTVRQAWQKSHDIHYLGGLFLFSALLDLYIIAANPSYALPFFCGKPTGLPGILAKLQSPIFHVAIGYGFLRVQPWALVAYLAYAGFGLLNAMVNYACFGFGRIRTVLFITLILFTMYVWGRRKAFLALPASP